MGGGETTTRAGKSSAKLVEIFSRAPTGPVVRTSADRSEGDMKRVGISATALVLVMGLCGGAAASRYEFEMCYDVQTGCLTVWTSGPAGADNSGMCNEQEGERYFGPIPAADFSGRQQPDAGSMRRCEHKVIDGEVVYDPQPGPAPPPFLRLATLMNLSPWQAWVHLYCGYGASDAGCTINFRCNGMREGELVTWDVTVPRETGFSYYPSKTADDGSSADLQAALMDAGKTEAEVRRRTTCEVWSPTDVAVRGYTRFGGDQALIPVAVYE